MTTFAVPPRWSFARVETDDGLVGWGRGGAGGAAGNFAAGFTVAHHVRPTFVVAGTGLAMALWGVSFGAVQLCQLTMTQAAAADAFEAAMSLNTLAYNTSIALGAFFGGLFADHLGVISVFWYGTVLTTTSRVLVVGSGRLVGPRAAATTT